MNRFCQLYNNKYTIINNNNNIKTVLFIKNIAVIKSIISNFF